MKISYVLLWMRQKASEEKYLFSYDKNCAHVPTHEETKI